MSHQSAMELMRERFRDEIQIPSDIIVAYQNDVPRNKDGEAVEDIGTATGLWARMTINPTPSERIEMGTPGRHRNPGLIIIQSFVPLQSGTKALYGFADTITTAFRSTFRDGIIYHRVDVADVARESEGWYQLNIQIPYSFDS